MRTRSRQGAALGGQRSAKARPGDARRGEAELTPRAEPPEGVDGGVEGTCGATDFGERGDCAHGRTESGAWHANASGLHTLAQCAARCRHCAACHYVSFSYPHDDCSWYTRCNLSALLDGRGPEGGPVEFGRFRSLRVQ